MACIWTNTSDFTLLLFRAFGWIQSEKFIPFSSSVGSFFPKSSHPSGSLEVLESRKVLVHCAEIQKRLLNCDRKFAFQRQLKELVLPPFSSSKEKTSGFSVPFVFKQLQDGKPCTCLCLSNLLSVNHFGHAGVVKRIKTWNYFISDVRKYFTAKIRSKGNKSLLLLPFVCCRRLWSHEWVPEPMFVHINCAVLQRKNYTVVAWCWHVFMALLSFGAVFCLHLAEE